MTRQTITIICLLFFIQTLASQNKECFPNLSYISLGTNYHGDFGYNLKTTRIINKLYCQSDSERLTISELDTICLCWIEVGKFKNERVKDSLTVIYSEGLGNDPRFEIYKKNGIRIGDFACLNLCLNDSGTIYTSGHTKSMYNKRRKFQIQNDTIIEVQQPYRYVGIKGRTIKPITLYQEKKGESIVAQLPENHEIEILLTESFEYDFYFEFNYLVKTEFGLIGWLRITNEDVFGSILKDFFYAGD